MRVAVQMDPIQAVDIEADTTFALMLEAEARGFEYYVYGPGNLALATGFAEGPGRPGMKVTALAQRARVRREAGNHVTLEAPETLDLGACDVVLMRQDPPFDMAYITAAHVLEHLGPETLVVNNPAEVRSAPEKLFATHFPDLMPPTVITADWNEIRAFRERHGDMILKPLYGAGGHGVFRLRPEDTNLNALLELFEAHFTLPMIAQAYLPAVREGDKRIILIEGEPVGALNRVPAATETRSNMHVGGRPEAIGMTERDQEICAQIGPVLKERGLVLVGIDVIGGVLTEVNVTSPTGIQEIRRFGGADIAALFWDAVLARKGV